MPSAIAYVSTPEFEPVIADLEAPKYDFKGMAFSVEIAKSALTDVDCVIGAFSWAHTPQGHKFWEYRCEEGLDEEGRKALQDMIDAYERTQAS